MGLDIDILQNGIIKVNNVPKYRIRPCALDKKFTYELWKVECISKDMQEVYGRLVFKDGIDNYGFNSLDEVTQWIKTKELV